MDQCILISGSIPTTSGGVLLSAAVPLGVYGEVCSQGPPVLIPVGRPQPKLLQFPASGSKVLTATPEKRRRGKSMSRRSGQNGYIERSGNWYVVRFWKDVTGQYERQHVRIKICPSTGAGLLKESQRKRRAREIIAASGADTVEHFEKVHAATRPADSTTFRQQAEQWLEHMQNRKRQPIATSTYKTWRSCLDRWLFPKLGALPLSAVDNDPVRELVCDMVESEELGPKSITEYIKVVRAVVASAKDQKTRKQLYPVVWDDEYLDLPIVKKKDQHRPAFDSDKLVTATIAAVKKTRERMLFILLAASGLRIGEALGLEIDKHLTDDCTTILIRQKVRQCKVESYVKTDNAYRDVDIHSSVAKMLKEYIGDRNSGFLFRTRQGNPLSDSDILGRHLHPALEHSGQEQFGHHAFRRFRVTWLRRQRCPADLRHFWLGHAGRTVEDYYDRLREDVEFRKQTVEEVGLGFELPTLEFRYKCCTECTEISGVELGAESAVIC